MNTPGLFEPLVGEVILSTMFASDFTCCLAEVCADLVGGEAGDTVVAKALNCVDGGHQEVDEYGHAPEEEDAAVQAAHDRVDEVDCRTL